MLAFLKNHPFAVEAHFDSSIVLTFAVPREQLQTLIPECLELDVFEDQWAFVAVAMVQTKKLRPKGFPKFLSSDFFLIGYRIFVRYTNRAGKRLRGLYILKSETDSKRMEWMGNLFTHYKYTTTDIQQRFGPGFRQITSQKSGFSLLIDESEPRPPLPIDSPFKNWKEARRFAGPLPFTFTYDAENKTVLMVEGVRENWTPKPIQVAGYRFEFLDDPRFKNAELANAFIIRDIPYYWKKGKTERWSP